MGKNVKEFEQFLHQNVWSPIEAIKELREQNSPIDLVILSHLNALPEFIAKCQGHRGKDRKTLDCRSGNEYLYVQGIRSLIQLDPSPDSEREVAKAQFLYENLRCQIAHSILAKKVVILTEPPRMNIQIDGDFGSGWFFRADGNRPVEDCDIECFLLYLPAFYKQIKDGVNKYVQNVKEGKCELKWSFN